MFQLILRCVVKSLVCGGMIICPTLMPRTNASAQETAAGPRPDFYVSLINNKTLLYRDEILQVAILRRADKPKLFVGDGQIEILRNGEVVKIINAGPVSMYSRDTIQGVLYSGFSMSLSFSNIDPYDEPKAGDKYQVRATFGNQVSEPTATFQFQLWSAPVDGLQVLLRPVKEVYNVGEPILLEVTMRNAGEKPRVCPVPMPDDGHMKYFWRFEPYPKDPRPRPPEDDVWTPRLQLLKPGESRTIIFSVNAYRRSDPRQTTGIADEPGKHRVWFSVFFHDDVQDIPKRLRKNLWRDQEMETNIVEIVVK